MQGVLAVIERAIATYILLMILFRIIGHRPLSQFTFKDYVVGICIGSISGRAITKLHEPYIYFAAAYVVLASLYMVVSYINLKNSTFRRFISGEPVILIYNGQIIRKNLKTAKVDLDDLASLLREKNIFEISDVQYAVLEPNGGFSVLPKSENRSLTPKDMIIQPTPHEFPVLIIKEGKLVTKELQRYNLS